MGGYGLITLYAAPRPFESPFGELQERAVRSWQGLMPAQHKLVSIPQIILVGDEEIDQAAERLRTDYVCVERGLDGIPFVPDIIRAAEEGADYKLRAMINAENVLEPTFLDDLYPLLSNLDTFVAIGRRVDLDPETDVETTGNYTAMDYFLYRGLSLAEDMPDFLVGRSFYDNWLVRETLRRGIPLVDLSLVLKVSHLSHPESVGVNKGQFAHNRDLCLESNLFVRRWTLNDATWQLRRNIAL